MGGEPVFLDPCPLPERLPVSHNGYTEHSEAQRDIIGSLPLTVHTCGSKIVVLYLV